MDRNTTLRTDRLLIEPVSENEADFIFELVNTEGWIKFIGDRNIHSATDAVAYIQKINTNPDIIYWTVALKETKDKIGVVSFVQRDYLEHKDIGFAFLPGFSNNGYAYEATKAVLACLVEHREATEIIAVTRPDNVNSIKLLRKLGLQFEGEIEIDNQTKLIYKVNKDLFNHNGFRADIR